MKKLAGCMGVACCAVVACCVVVGLAETRAAAPKNLTAAGAETLAAAPGTLTAVEAGTWAAAPGNLTVAEKASDLGAQLRPALQELQVAANAHDTDRFMAWYGREAGLIAVFNGVEIHGWNDLHAQQLKWWNGGKSDVVYTMRGDPEIMALGPDAAVVTLMEGSTRTLADGSAAQNDFAISMVWKKLPEGWRMVYSHESTVH